MRRRAFIESGILGASALALPRFAVAQVAADAPATEVVRGDLQLIRGAANGLLFAAGDRNVLIDVPAPDFDGPAALYRLGSLGRSALWSAGSRGTAELDLVYFANPYRRRRDD